jgi:hypothetical protein
VSFENPGGKCFAGGILMNSRQKIAFENPSHFDLNRKEGLYREIVSKDGLTIESILTVRALFDESAASWNVEMAVLDDQGFRIKIRSMDGRQQSQLRHLGLELLDDVGVHDWRFLEYPDSIHITKSMSPYETEQLNLLLFGRVA